MARFLDIGPRLFADGSAERIGPEWENLGFREGDGIDHVGSWGFELLPFPDATFDLVHASHVLEHIPWERGIDALKEAHRIIKHGGQLEVHVPDTRVLIKRFLEDKPDTWSGHGLIPTENGKKVIGAWFNARVMGFSSSKHWTEDRPEYRHLAMYDLAYLKYCMTQAGFVELKRAGPPRGGEKHQGFDLGLIGRKR